MEGFQISPGEHCGRVAMRGLLQHSADLEKFGHGGGHFRSLCAGLLDRARSPDPRLVPEAAPALTLDPSTRERVGFGRRSTLARAAARTEGDARR